MRPHYYFLDVFAEQKYAANQLAVFRGAGGLSSEEMQKIAREINFSETTFIVSEEPKDGGFAVRIFTPKAEMPFAGHPTLGTAHILREKVLQGQGDRVVLNLQVGQIPVTWDAGGYAWMKQVQPEFGAQHSAAALADVLGLQVGEIDERFPIQEVSTGLRFFIVPLKSLAALQKARANKDKYYDLIARTEAKMILIFCPEPHEPQNDLSVRMFADAFGVPEDPATGSANGCLAGYLTKHRYFGQPRINVRAEQGYEIDRPSLLLLKAEQSGSGIEILVGGRSVEVAEGDWG